jgi:hypothetical protein
MLGLVAFAALAALGNALYALGQRQATGSTLVVAAASALIACLLAVLAALATVPDAGTAAAMVARLHWRALLLSGGGLFLTYVGFNLLYTRYGAQAYVVYAARGCCASRSTATRCSRCCSRSLPSSPTAAVGRGRKRRRARRGGGCTQARRASVRGNEKTFYTIS